MRFYLRQNYAEFLRDIINKSLGGVMSKKLPKLNPNYSLVNIFLERNEQSVFFQKSYQLAVEIGNCILKVGKRPEKSFFRKLKKFFIKTRWFKKVRIIYNQLYLFRKRGRFAIRLTKSAIYNLQCLAKKVKAEKHGYASP